MDKSERVVVIFCLAVMGLVAFSCNETEIASAVVGGLCGILAPKKE